MLLGQFGRRILAETDLLRGNTSFLYVYLTYELTTNTLDIGRPLGPARQVPGAPQAFERGWMVSRADQRWIYVLCGTADQGQLVVPGTPASGQTPYFVDTWTSGQEPGGGPAPTPGRYLPQRGFGQVWRDGVDTYRATTVQVRDCLGYAVTPTEQQETLAVQPFERGLMLATPEGRVVAVLWYSQAAKGGLFTAHTRYQVPAQYAGTP